MLRICGNKSSEFSVPLLDVPPATEHVSMADLRFAFLSALFSAIPFCAHATDFDIKMLNHGPDGMMQFDPQLLKIAVGDVVHFQPIDKGHNVQSFAGMIPEAGTPFSSKVDEPLTVKFTTPGVYGYHCGPHESLGMVGLIVVGEPANEDAAKASSVPGMARQVFVKLFQKLDALRTAQK